jgi:hypothetical protein
MTAKDILRFLYWKAMPAAIGVVVYLYIDKMEVPLLYKVLIFLVVAIPVATIRVFVGTKLFKEKQTLTDKIMSCQLRKKYGNEYCVVCPDNYKCASGSMKKT